MSVVTYQIFSRADINWVLIPLSQRGEPCYLFVIVLLDFVIGGKHTLDVPNDDLPLHSATDADRVL